MSGSDDGSPQQAPAGQVILEDGVPDPRGPTAAGMAAAGMAALTEALQEVLRLSPAPGSTPAPRQPVKELCPDRYDGKDSTRLLTFVFGCRTWLRSGTGLSVAQQIALVGGRLSGTAAQSYMGWAESGMLAAETLEGFFSRLHRQFGDPDAAATARTAFQREVQGGHSVTEYAGKLRTLLTTPGLQDISPEAQVHKFRAGLTSEIKTALLLYDYDTLDEIVAAAHKIERRMSKPRAAALNPIPTRLQLWRSSGRGRWTPGGRGSRQSNALSGRGRSGPAGRGRPRDQALVAGTSGRSLPGVQCFYCKNWGHMQGDCPEQPQGGYRGAGGPDGQ